MTRSVSLAIPLAGLLAETAGGRRRVELRDITISLDDELRLASPIQGSVEISRTNRGVLIQSRIQAALGTDCSRCLGPAVIPLDIEIREEALPSIDLGSGMHLDLAAEPEVTRLNGHHELDMEPLLREAIELAEPIAPLCRPDCPGLCVVCGERLEAGRHEHDADQIDPRLAALQAFRVDGEGENE